MTDKNESLIIFRVLVLDDELHLQTASGRATRDLVSELRRRQIVVVESESAEDAYKNRK